MILFLNIISGLADEDVTTRIKKSNAVFVQLYPLWKAWEISTRTKLRIFSQIYRQFYFLIVKLRRFPLLSPIDIRF